MGNLKLVKVANVRKHMDAHFRYEISYTEAVNRINEDANQALNIANVVGRSEQLKAYAKLLQERYVHNFFDDAIDESIKEFESL